MCSETVSNSCSTCDKRRVTGKGHEHYLIWGKSVHLCIVSPSVIVTSEGPDIQERMLYKHDV
jgi:hypothetical protein